MRKTQSLSKRTVFGKTTYKVDGRNVSRNEYERVKKTAEKSEILDPNAQYTFDTKYIGVKATGRDRKCPEGYHWVNTYRRMKNRFVYKREIVRGHCAKNK